MSDQPNFKYISRGCYVVRTQAGLEQAIKHWLGGEKPDGELLSFPRSYPSVVCLSTMPHGVYVNAVHINTMREAIKDQ